MEIFPEEEEEEEGDDEEKTTEDIELQRLLKIYDTLFDETHPPLTPGTPPVVVGRILLTYLESLPEPLIPKEYYHTYIRVIQIGSREQRLIQLRILFRNLPAEASNVIAYLCTYLTRYGLNPNIIAKRFREIFIKSPDGSIDYMWEKEIVKTFIEEINYLQENTAHLEYVKDDPKDYFYSLLANKPYALHGEALYDYRSTNKWVLSFKKGSIFKLYDIKTNESGWVLGVMPGSGREGFIPETYISIIPEDRPNLTWEHRLPPEESDRLAKTMEGRKIHATEILTTERTYVENLKILDGVLATLKENSMGLPASDVMTMFPSVETLKVCHEKLLEVFEKCLQEWDNDSTMGKIFIENMKFIKLYRHYINGYKDATETVIRCRHQYPEFGKYLDSLEKKPEMHGNKLSDVLITPVQRLPRYVLLLKDMINSTPSTHPDKQYVEDAYTLVKELADYVNKMKEVADNILELQKLQKKFFGYTGKLDSLPTRRFIKDRPITINKEKVRMWIFDDMALITKPEPKDGDVYKYRYQIDFQTSKISKAEGENLFKLFTLTSTTAYTMQFDNTKERNNAFSELDQIIEGAKENLLDNAYNPRQLTAIDGSQAYNSIENDNSNKNRSAIFERMRSTDNAYVKDIETYMKAFVKPIQDSGILDETTSRTIFFDLEGLYERAVRINKDLNSRFKEWNDASNSADIFIGHEEDLCFYIHYATHYPEQMFALDRAKESKAFSNFLHEWEISANLSIRTVLELPIRKLSEYQAALQEMHANSRNHAEYESLGNVIKKLKAMNEEIFHRTNKCLDKTAKKKSM